MTAFDTDVLIAGAGPVGLMAATALARAGVHVRLVDAATGPATTSRALGVHARSMEIYDQLGLIGEIAPHGTRVNAFVRSDPERTDRLDFDYSAVPTRFAFMMNLDQVILERVFRAAAAREGVTVEWSTTLETFTQDEDGVTATLQHEDGGDETVRARYLWGCDGGHSRVRKTLGLPLEGDSTHTWLIADAQVQTDLARDGVHWLFPEDGALMLFPFPEGGKWRLLDTTGEGDPDDPARIARSFTEKISRALDRTVTASEPSWSSRFTIQQRAVPAMHVGRCFVSGDAAHIHSPASGQGLNTGVQDAVNLAWKLAMVLRGEADASLLATYDAERVPIGQALLASTGKVMETVMTNEDGSDAAPGAPPAMADSTLIQHMSGLKIAYPASPLTIGPDGAGHAGPRPGERLVQVTAEEAQSAGWTMLREALRAPGWQLLTVGADEPLVGGELPGWLGRIEIVAERPAAGGEHGVQRVWDPEGRVGATLGTADESWLLVRPDGYLSARGTGKESLRAALEALHTQGLRR